jgi:thymidylate synthase (FAD)
MSVNQPVWISLDRRYLGNRAVDLVWITPDAQNVISYCARVSNPSNQSNFESAPKLIKYLAKNKHWSPFEMASMCVEINTTRAIAAQILRHRSFSFQEFSQRYASVDDTSIDIPHLRRQDIKNRQNSIDDIEEVNVKYREKIEAHYKQSIELYKDMLTDGVAKECARFVLPLSTQTRIYMSGSIRSWIHYCQVRCDPSTQKEHREIAMQVKAKLIESIPMLEEILQE